MPLAHTPFRPRPVVEFLGAKTISPREAAEGLCRCLEGDVDEAQCHQPGSTLVNFRQIPSIIESLERDWVRLRVRTDCFAEVHGRLETHLHPCFLGEKLVLGLRGAAGTMLLHFNRTLRCVPLGFTRLQPAGSHGAIVAESPYVHFSADFKAISFVPQKGQWLVGRPAETQTEKGLNVSLLNVFNMFINAPDLPGEVKYHERKKVFSYRNPEEGAKRTLDKRSVLWVRNDVSLETQPGDDVPTLYGKMSSPLFACIDGKRVARPGRTSPSPERRPAMLQNGLAVKLEPSVGDDKVGPSKSKAGLRLPAALLREKGEVKDEVKYEDEDTEDDEDDVARTRGLARPVAAGLPVDAAAKPGRRRRRSSGGLDSSHHSGPRKDALQTGTLKKRRSHAVEPP